MFDLVRVEIDAEMNVAIADTNRAAETKRIKSYYDRKRKDARLEPGQLVLWHVHETGAGKSKKLNSKWQGPYRVVELDPPRVKLVDRNGKPKVVHLNHVKRTECDKELGIFRGRGRPRIQRGRCSG